MVFRLSWRNSSILPEQGTVPRKERRLSKILSRKEGFLFGTLMKPWQTRDSLSQLDAYIVRIQRNCHGRQNSTVRQKNAHAFNWTNIQRRHCHVDKPRQ